jgi:hypothetical protein
VKACPLEVIVAAGAVRGNGKVYVPAIGALKLVEQAAAVVEVAAGAGLETKVFVY